MNVAEDVGGLPFFVVLVSLVFPVKINISVVSGLVGGGGSTLFSASDVVCDVFTWLVPG